MENVEYDLAGIKEYFQDYNTPQETSAKIDRVTVLLTKWFIEVGDPCANVTDLKEAVDFLYNLRTSINCINPVTEQP